MLKLWLREDDSFTSAPRDTFTAIAQPGLRDCEWTPSQVRYSVNQTPNSSHHSP